MANFLRSISRRFRRVTKNAGVGQPETSGYQQVSLVLFFSYINHLYTLVACMVKNFYQGFTWR